ncbi:DUF937 domain-containing protein [Mesonia mobilis]|uniref:DUF937 domain-containing protein n=1 Tax=Mesonia mobilis TaxID=369791 RepID=A0ABQ3BMB6_9FLAO|nr:DUF937 domain-containing protein [Mesonia mobilis]MBQ0738344.1 hypothetical protein [Aquimarina celericrescens]GGZ47671.1 hypothetical protein GCM10008088_06600 [Mesonia mobilis]
MLDSLLGSLKDQVAGKLQSEAGVDSSNIDGVMDVVKSVAGKKVGTEMLEGGLGNVMNLFSGKSNSTAANSLQTSITTGIVNGLIEKLGFSKDKASKVTNIVVPVLINLISKKNEETPDDDASPLKDLFGGGGSNVAKKLGGFFN